MGYLANKKADKGFSLIEMIVVMVILSIILSIGGFVFYNYKQKINFRIVIRALVADFNYIKQKAIAESVHYKIRFNVTNNNYKIIKGGPHGYPQEYDEANAIVKELYDLAQNVKISSAPAPNYDNSEMVFQPRGTLSAGTIVLENDGYSKAKLISNITGKIRVEFD